ncbi:MAG: hypothetical protein ACI9DK_002227, partial [Vicingaceae bacterium]
MTILTVNNATTEKEFHQLPFSIYKEDKSWVPHLKQDIEKVFDNKQNKFFRHGEAVRWIAQKDGKTIGRIAAFINEKANKKSNTKIGGIGFFECMNDEKAAFQLFEIAKQWIKNRGMDTIEGPINFGEKDKYWGLIIENFEYPPYSTQTYNP